MFFNVFIVLVVVSFMVRTVRVTLYHVYLWQLKEYRFDRYLAFLKTKSGKKLLFSPLSLLKWLLIFLIYGFKNPEVVIYSFYFFWLIWVLELLLALKEYLKGNWRFPKLTLKSSLLLGSVLLFEFAPMITLYWTAPLLIGPFFDKLLSILVVVFILVLSLPVKLVKKISGIRAEGKI